MFKVLILLMGFSLVCSAQNKPFFVINSHGHISNIRDIVYANGTLISGGFDKTVNLWDIKNQRRKGELRQFTGEGSEGMIYTMALSRDSNYLAIAGWLGPDDESGPLGDIRVFDLGTSKMVRVLKGLDADVHKICFSRDGKRIYAGASSGRVMGWNFSSSTTVFDHVIEGEGISGLDEYSGDLIFTDRSGIIGRISIAQKKMQRSNGIFKEKGYAPDEIKFSPDGKEIAVTGGPYILILDRDFTIKQIIDNIENPSRIAYAPDGSKILTGSYTVGAKHYVNVYHKFKKVYEKYTSFDQHTQAVLAITWLDNETCATAGGENEEIMTWRIKDKGEKPDLIYTYQGKGSPVYAATFDKNIYFTRNWSENFGMSAYDEQFNINLRSFIREVQQPLNENRPITSKGSYTLMTRRGGNEIEELTAILDILSNDETQTSIKKEWWNGGRHNVFTFTPNNYIVSAGSYGMMYAYDLQGREVSRFIGHTGDIWSVSVINERQWLVSGGSDQTIKIWDMKAIGRSSEVNKLPSVYEYCEQMQVIDTYKKVFKLTKTTETAVQRTLTAWETTINELDKQGWPCNFLKSKLNAFQVKPIYPIASMYFTTDGEWIIWNEDGYFMSSLNGTKYVGYHVNQSKDKEAKFYPFEQFDLKYNRPDIIMGSLDLARADMIDIYKKAYQKRLRKMHIKEEDLAGDIHAPTLEISEKGFKDQKYLLHIEAVDTRSKLDRINVYVNNVPVYGSAGINLRKINTNSYQQAITLDLLPGNNKIQVSVLNKYGQESLKETIYTFNDMHEEKPTLYFIGLGVSEYQDKVFNLKYAAKDVKSVLNVLKKSGAFKEVQAYTLLDQQVTLESLSEVKAFLKDSDADDVVMVFVAGHGVLDNQFDYYFASYDMNFNDPSKKGIAYTDIETLIDGIPALRKLLIMDTCHSGEVDKEDVEKDKTVAHVEGNIVFRNAGAGVRKKQGIGVEMTQEIMKEMFTDLRWGAGATVIASSGGAELAMESDKWQNGLFTYCLLQALTTREADTNHDGMIYVSELRTYVDQKVQELSGGKQSPTTRTENLSMDYRIW